MIRKYTNGRGSPVPGLSLCNHCSFAWDVPFPSLSMISALSSFRSQFILPSETPSLSPAYPTCGLCPLWPVYTLHLLHVFVYFSLLLRCQLQRPLLSCSVLWADPQPALESVYGMGTLTEVGEDGIV